MYSSLYCLRSVSRWHGREDRGWCFANEATWCREERVELEMKQLRRLSGRSEKTKEKNKRSKVGSYCIISIRVMAGRSAEVGSSTPIPTHSSQKVTVQWHCIHEEPEYMKDCMASGQSRLEIRRGVSLFHLPFVLEDDVVAVALEASPPLRNAIGQDEDLGVLGRPRAGAPCVSAKLLGQLLAPDWENCRRRLTGHAGVRAEHVERQLRFFDVCSSGPARQLGLKLALILWWEEAPIRHWKRQNCAKF